jgi:hypothetical protein
MQMNGDHLQMTGHITLMGFIVIIHSKGQQLLSWFVAKGQPINRIPLGFGTTDLNGDGASSDAYQGNSDRFRKAEIMIVSWSTTFDLGLQHQITIWEIIN